MILSYEVISGSFPSQKVRCFWKHFVDRDLLHADLQAKNAEMIYETKLSTSIRFVPDNFLREFGVRKPGNIIKRKQFQQGNPISIIHLKKTLGLL